MKSGNHILLISPGFAADERDDVCIPALQQFLIHYRELYPGTDFTILALHYPYHKMQYHWKGINVYALGGNNRGRWYKPVLWRKAQRLIAELHRASPFSGVHSFWLGETALLGNHFAGRFHLSHLITLMGQEVLKKKPLFHPVIRNAASLIALSPFQASYLQSTSGIAADKIIPWGAPSASPLPKTVDISGAGNLVALKRFDLWLQTVAILRENFPQINAILAGEGSEKTRLQHMIKDLNLDKNITLAGQLSHRQTLALIASSKIMLHTSAFEGFGYAMAEALAAGVQVVASPVGIGASDDAVRRGNSPAEWASEIRKILEDAHPAQIANPYSIGFTCDRYYELYKKYGMVS